MDAGASRRAEKGEQFAGKPRFDMLDVFAEFETNLWRERQAESIVAAKKRGIYKGRLPNSTATRSNKG